MKINEYVTIHHEHGILTTSDLLLDAERWAGYAVPSGLFIYSNPTELLRAVLYRYLPAEITASNTLILRAECAQWPYSIKGRLGFTKFSLRVYPEIGNLDDSRWDLNHLGQGSFCANSKRLHWPALGNGSCNLEIYLMPPKLPLELLLPPTGYTEA